MPPNASELPDYTRELYRSFNDNEGLARAARSSVLGRELRSRGQAVRNRATRTAIAAYAPELSPVEQGMAASLIRLIVSAIGWQNLRDVYELDGEDAAHAASWAVRTLLSNLHTLKKEKNR
jgi:hypothetical protein